MQKARKIKRLSLPFFVMNVLGTLILIFGGLRVVSPSVWKIQVSASLWIVLGAFALAHLTNAFAEFFFHRYILHVPAIPLLSHFWKRHTLHHALTHVVERHGVVENIYPITEEKQHEASFFPWYSTLVFCLIAIVPLALVQWILPNTPVFLSGWLAIALNVTLYEIIHSLEHRSNAWWRPFFEHPRFGRFWKTAYGFHERHHADMKSNEAISGFFGFPVADLVFRTWVRPRFLYPNGVPILESDFASPRPIFLIRWCDRLAAKLEKRFHTRQKKRAIKAFRGVRVMD